MSEKKFCLKRIKVQTKILGKKNFKSNKNLGVKNIMGPKKIILWIKNYFGFEKNLCHRKFGSKQIFCDQNAKKILVTKILVCKIVG